MSHWDFFHFVLYSLALVSCRSIEKRRGLRKLNYGDDVSECQRFTGKYC